MENFSIINMEIFGIQIALYVIGIQTSFVSKIIETE